MSVPGIPHQRYFPLTVRAVPTTAHLPPMIDFDLLNTIHGKCAGRTKYKLGAKCPLDAQTQDIHQIDCSGYVRYLMHRACGHDIPDGSQNQLAWARKNLRQLAKYSDVTYAKDDPNRLFIGFLKPKPGDEWPRHVFLIKHAQTMESCSSRGVTSRPWNSSALVGCVDVFEVL